MLLRVQKLHNLLVLPGHLPVPCRKRSQIILLVRFKVAELLGRVASPDLVRWDGSVFLYVRAGGNDAAGPNLRRVGDEFMSVNVERG